MASYLNSISAATQSIPSSPLTATTSSNTSTQDTGTAQGDSGTTQSSTSSTSSSASSSSSATKQDSLQNYLDTALKNSSYKAEINFEHGGYSVVSLVDTDTGRTVLQMPSQTVLALIASMEQQDSEAMATSASTSNAGALINQFA